MRLDPMSLRIRCDDADKRLLSRRRLALCSLVMSNRWLLCGFVRAVVPYTIRSIYICLGLMNWESLFMESLSVADK